MRHDLVERGRICPTGNLMRKHQPALHIYTGVALKLPIDLWAIRIRHFRPRVDGMRRGVANVCTNERKVEGQGYALSS